MAGQDVHRFNISNISNASKCIVTTSATNDFTTGQFVRIMDVNGCIPVKRGSDQVNFKRFLVEVVDTTHFKLKDAITHDYVNSTSFTPYVSGGNVGLVQFSFNYEA